MKKLYFLSFLLIEDYYTMSKKDLGAFYSTNINEMMEGIFDDFIIFYDKEKIIYEPCCGNGDIVKFLIDNSIKENKILCYDIINLSFNQTTQRDTILNPLNFKDSYVITNPPFLGKNKMTKEMKNKYKDLENCQDLYETYIIQLINSDCIGGILILPSNFLFSYNNNIRKQFIKAFEIKKLKIYEKQIFNDTTSSVIIFDFINRKHRHKDNFTIDTFLITEKTTEHFDIEISENNNYTYGYELYKEKYKSDFKILRYIKEKNDYCLSCIEVKTIDPKIEALYVSEPQINKITDRSKINFLFNYKFKENEEKYIIKSFNEKIKKYRKKYHSLFMSSFREFNRKRISFDLVYTILKNIINNMIYYFETSKIDNNIVYKLCKISNYFDFSSIYRYLNEKLEKINLNHFIQNYKSDYYVKKYKNYYDTNFILQNKYSCFDDFLNYIYENINVPIIQSLFVKKTNKQSIHEIIQIYLVELKLNMKFKTHIKDKLSDTKSFDGVNHENKIYLCCKYIKESGGSQDNQIKDLLKFNDYSHETDYKIYFIVSGSYGIKKIKEYENILNSNVCVLYLF